MAQDDQGTDPLRQLAVRTVRFREDDPPEVREALLADAIGRQRTANKEYLEPPKRREN